MAMCIKYPVTQTARERAATIEEVVDCGRVRSRKRGTGEETTGSAKRRRTKSDVVSTDRPQRYSTVKTHCESRVTVRSTREREKICFAFYAVCSFSCACEIFSIFPFLVFQKLARVALGHSNLKTAVSFRPKKTQKWTLFHASKRGREESSKVLR